MLTPALFHESLADALRECVAVCGGMKAVGAKLWPEQAPDQAGRHLSDCLNDAKREKLAPEQVLLVMRMARERGCHTGMVYLSRELGYTDPQLVEPEEEKAKLQRDYIEAARAMSKMAARIEALEQRPALRSAA